MPLEHLDDRQGLLAAFGNHEDLGVAAYDEHADPAVRGLAFHLEGARNALIGECGRGRSSSAPTSSTTCFLRDRRPHRQRPAAACPPRIAARATRSIEHQHQWVNALRGS